MKKTILLLTILLSFCSLAFAEDITSSRAIKEFFGEHTELRIAGKSIEAYKATLNELSQKVIQKAQELAKEDKRKTVLERDIEEASEEVFRRAPMTISELMEKIKQLSIIKLVDLNKKIKAYNEELQNNKE